MGKKRSLNIFFYQNGAKFVLVLSSLWLIAPYGQLFTADLRLKLSLTFYHFRHDSAAFFLSFEHARLSLDYAASDKVEE